MTKLFNKGGDGAGEIVRVLGLIDNDLDFTKWEPILPLGIRDLQGGRQRLGLQTTECKCEYGSYQSFFHYFRLYVRMRLLAERISKHSAKGNIAGGILCGIIVQSPIKSVKTAKLTSI